LRRNLEQAGTAPCILLKLNKTGNYVAIKAIQKLKVKDYESFITEMNILKGLDHPNIYKLYETWETDRIWFLSTEYCKGGELFYYIVKQENKHLTEGEAALIMRQSFSALKYLHENSICHRDIKPENFLLYKDKDPDNIKVIDFGLAKKLSENEIMSNPNGTAYYIAPEVLKGDYTVKCDIWSMGVVLYIMMCGRPPFKGKTNPEIINSVLKGEYNFDYPSFETASEDVKDFISKWLETDVDSRMSAAEAYDHPWIQKQWEKEEKTLTIPEDVPDSIMDFMNAVNFK
jgi:calcium-dependent protein kinase